jgi:hypothetical protein
VVTPKRAAAALACAGAIWCVLALEGCDGCSARPVGGAAGGETGGDSGASTAAGGAGAVGAGGKGAGGVAGTGAVGGMTAAGGAGGDPTATAAELCDQLTTSLCARSVECVATGAAAICESQLRLEFGCDRAAGADFLACLADARAVACDALLPAGGLTLPPACLAPITAIPLNEAQVQCYALVDQLCARGIQCAGRIPSSADVQDCEDDVTTNHSDGIPCLLATRVGPGYAPCAAAIPTLPCEGGGMGAIPSCGDALIFAP